MVTYDDINGVNTFGFTGEAQSIISYISDKLSIISKTEKDDLAHM